jgi:NTE family protein
MAGDIGLVFGGGGGKAAYQAGVWQALDEMGLAGRVSAVAGTSAGALNGALFSAGDLSAAVSAWSGVSESSILTHGEISASGKAAHAYRKGVAKNGWFSNDGVRAMIERHIDIGAIVNGGLPFYAACSRLNRPAILYGYIQFYANRSALLKAVCALMIKLLPAVTSVQYFKVNNYPVSVAEAILLGSAAIPLVFPDIVVEGEIYVDGGLKDNVPVQPLYDAGLRRFVVVVMDADYEPPKAKLAGADFLVIKSDEGNAVESLAGTLDFTARDAKLRMKRGREDCLARAAEIYEFFRAK